MFKKILIGLLVVVIVFIGIVLRRPNNFRVERKAVISAPASVVFDQVNDLHKWQAWSPWAKLDPAAKIEYAGPSSGTGAGFSWAGNNDVGVGKMTIVDNRINESVTFKLDFEKPFKGTNDAVFTFKPEGDKTVVTWAMSGKNNFLTKAVGLFINCDKMVGGQFEQGLANLDSVSQTAIKK